MEPEDSLIMGDEHLSTIPEKESDEIIKSSVEDLIPIPSESEDISDNYIECELPFCDDSSPNKNEGLDDIIDFLLEEFVGELALINPIPPRIDEADFDPKGDIRLIEKLLYDNLSPRPPEDLNSEKSDAVIESFSPSPIPVEDNDSLMEEIDIFLAPDDSIPPSIENDDYDSEGDIIFLKELLSNDSLSLPENESSVFDRYYDPSSPRPPVKPPDDDDGIYFDAEPDTGNFILIDTLLPFLSKNEDKIFNPGILASNEEKTSHLLSHRGFKAFQLISDFSESPMMIYGGDIPILDVLFLHFYPP
ncbi:hypothetical protein Tco_1309922 [Tanacetum coccineum]